VPVGVSVGAAVSAGVCVDAAATRLGVLEGPSEEPNSMAAAVPAKARTAAATRATMVMLERPLPFSFISGPLMRAKIAPLRFIFIPGG
jgi:hypothetical protein